MPAPHRPVSIILLCDPAEPAREHVLRARACLRYAPLDWEVILVVAGATPAEERLLTSFTANRDNARSLIYPSGTPVSSRYIRAARKATGTALLFCDEAVRFSAHSGLTTGPMLEHALTNGIGPVGCLLLEADKKHIFAAGLAKPPEQPFRRLYGGHLLKRTLRHLGTRTYRYDLRKSRPVIAVSGALMISRATYRALGGFTDLPAATSSQLMVELCLRANRTKRQTWFSASGSMMVRGGPEPNLQPAGAADDDPFSPDAPDNRARPKPPAKPKPFRLPRIRNPFRRKPKTHKE